LNSLLAVNKTQLQSKSLADLHDLAAEAGIERYRMLSKAELVEKLADGDGGEDAAPKREPASRQRRERKPRQRREPKAKAEAKAKAEEPDEPEPAAEPKPESTSAAATTSAAARPKRKRRRRWGRRPKGLRVQDLVLPATAGRQTIVYAESREACTALLRELAAELSAASDGPDPVALLIDPSPEELAEWKRDAPQAELVAAGKANHADDAIAQARSRAEGGEDVIVLIDSLSRYAEDFAGSEEARALFDASVGARGGSLTVVAAIERSA
jgi:Rho termination factor, N-terminal domain